ncbi:recombinase family protein, partial [Alkalibacillus haloalkaliphilus]|uniref:recombinase family protein n=1 Tax=Alkalibacillus haloalkaliphilus TaxID=94136 RepID=UPI00036D23D9
MGHGLRAAIYIRVSTEEQKKGYSLEAQEETLKEYAAKKSYQVVDVYSDGGFSGKDFNRPAFRRMMNDIEEDKVDIILVWKVDRLSRSTSDVTTLIDKVLTPKDKSIVLAAIDMNSSDSVGKMFISMLGVFAAYERATIIDRVSSGMNQRAKQGYRNGGLVLGYDSVDGELVINKEEAKIVKEIFELRAGYHGYKAIAIKMNEWGYKTKRDNQFTINSVKTIINSPLYVGKIRWGQYRDWSNKRRNGKSEPLLVEGRHEPIISQDLWKQVQIVNSENNRNFNNRSRQKNHKLLLSGVIRCPQCGAGTVFSKSKRKKGGYYYYYMCQRSHNGGKKSCRSNLIRKDVIEPQVINLFKSLLQMEKQLIDEVLFMVNEQKEEGNGFLEELKIKQDKLQELGDRRNKLDNDYFSEKISPETYNRLMRKLENEINELNDVIQKFEDHNKEKEVSL